MNDVRGRVVRKSERQWKRRRESKARKSLAGGWFLQRAGSQKLPNMDLMHQIIAKSFMWWIECISKKEYIKLSIV